MILTGPGEATSAFLVANRRLCFKRALIVLRTYSVPLSLQLRTSLKGTKIIQLRRYSAQFRSSSDHKVGAVSAALCSPTTK